VERAARGCRVARCQRGSAERPDRKNRLNGSPNPDKPSGRLRARGWQRRRRQTAAAAGLTPMREQCSNAMGVFSPCWCCCRRPVCAYAGRCACTLGNARGRGLARAVGELLESAWCRKLVYAHNVWMFIICCRGHERGRGRQPLTDASHTQWESSVSSSLTERRQFALTCCSFCASRLTGPRRGRDGRVEHHLMREAMARW
jgi:hypothetical protein